MSNTTPNNTAKVAMTCADAGRKGGQSRSEAKRAAGRRNAAKATAARLARVTVASPPNKTPVQGA